MEESELVAYFTLTSFLLLSISIFFEVKETFTKENDEISTLEEKSQDLTIITGLFLLVLAVSGNFIAETMGCKVQYYLSNNMFLKNIVIIMVVYFSLGFSDTQNNSPIIHLRRSLLIWGFFLLFNKMHIRPTTLCFFLLLTCLIIKNYIDYFSNIDKEKYKDTIELLLQIINVLFFFILGIVFIGFYFYYLAKREEYQRDFNFGIFLFGKTTCRNDAIFNAPKQPPKSINHNSNFNTTYGYRY